MSNLSELVNELSAAFADARLEAPRREAEALVCGLLEATRATLLAHPTRPVEPGDAERVRAAAARRVRREPLAYILGQREFWSVSLEVTPAVLIPRPSTETLVEAALALVDPEAETRILDVGTGSLAIVAALARELARARFTAVDVSADALAVARRNVDRLGLSERVELRRSDLFGGLAPRDGPFDLVVSNPPYVPEGNLAHLMADVRDFEPVAALLAGHDGLAVLRPLVDEAPAWLGPAGWLVVEHGAEQGDAVAELFAAAGYGEQGARNDLEGHSRVAWGRRPAGLTLGKARP